MRLILAHIAHFADRKSIRLSGLIALVGLGAIGLSMFLGHRDLPEAIALKTDHQFNQLEQFREEAVVRCREGVKGPAGFRQLPETRENCEREWTESVVSSDRARMHFARTQTLMVRFGVGYLILGWLIGALAAGGEWSTGRILSFITWEPRRTRMFWSMMLAIGGMVAIATLVAEMIFLAVTLPSGMLRGTFHGIESQWWLDTAAVMLRTAAVTGYAGAIGASLAFLARGTGGSLGAALVVFFLNVFLFSVGNFENSLLFSAVETFVSTSLGYGSSLSTLQGVAQLTSVAALTAGASWLVFIRRDLAF